MRRRDTPELAEARYRINTVARRIGVHSSTIKRLEARGIFVPSRDCAGHRRYAEGDVVQLRKILFG